MLLLCCALYVYGVAGAPARSAPASLLNMLCLVCCAGSSVLLGGVHARVMPFMRGEGVLTERAAN